MKKTLKSLLIFAVAIAISLAFSYSWTANFLLYSLSLIFNFALAGGLACMLVYICAHNEPSSLKFKYRWQEACATLLMCIFGLAMIIGLIYSGGTEISVSGSAGTTEGVMSGAIIGAVVGYAISEKKIYDWYLFQFISDTL